MNNKKSLCNPQITSWCVIQFHTQSCGLFHFWVTKHCQLLWRRCSVKAIRKQQ